MKKVIQLLLLCVAVLAYQSCKTADEKYKSSSFVEISSYTERNIEDLYLLCKVWGFMRFHHPNVVMGDGNWDFELFRIMPLVLDAKTKDERNSILAEWVKDQGAVEPELKDTTYSDVKLAPDFSWINPNDLGELWDELLKVKNGKKDFYPRWENMLLVDSILKKDEAYAELPTLPDTGYRLLTLFRYWNIIEYFFPYKYLIGESWDKVLLDFIPQFIEVNDEIAYRMLILKLTASINDTHAYTSDEVLFKHIGNRSIPLQLTFIEGKAAVTELYKEYETLKKGDVIMAINGKPVDSIVSEWLPYTAASNYPTKLRNIAYSMLRTSEAMLDLTYERDGVRKAVSLATYQGASLKRMMDKYDKPLYQYLEDDIFYLYLGSQKGGTIPDSIIAKGIIVDLRCYPSRSVNGYWDFIQLYPEPIECAVFTEPLQPGLFISRNTNPSAKVGEINPNYFRGKKVILVNTETQSQAEFMAMRYRYAPNSVIIGSTTAGADGNVLFIILPGNIKTAISGLGVYYPDGRETQRIGIVPDIEVTPTIKGIREGRDELLEVAIGILNEK